MGSISLFDKPEFQAISGSTVIVYDGECPFCSRFVAWQRLKRSVGPVKIVDARAGGRLVKLLWEAGFDLNKGMVLIWRGQVFHGDECVNRLALLSGRSDLFNRMNAFLFSSPSLTRLLYPPMRLGRNLTLRMLGRSKLPRDK